ncbi:MAG: hypothetical protein ACYDAG_18470, partial [Chloroflexota bacterium]
MTDWSLLAAEIASATADGLKQKALVRDRLAALPEQPATRPWIDHLAESSPERERASREFLSDVFRCLSQPAARDLIRDLSQDLGAAPPAGLRDSAPLQDLARAGLVLIELDGDGVRLTALGRAADGLLA